MLADKGVDNAEGLTRTGSSKNKRTTESGTWVLFNVLIIS